MARSVFAANVTQRGDGLRAPAGVDCLRAHAVARVGSVLVSVHVVDVAPGEANTASNCRKVEPNVPLSCSHCSVAWSRTLTRTRLTPAAAAAVPMNVTGDPTVAPGDGLVMRESGSAANVVVGGVAGTRHVPLAESVNEAPASGTNEVDHPLAVSVRASTPKVLLFCTIGAGLLFVKPSRKAPPVPTTNWVTPWVSEPPDGFSAANRW